MVISDLRLKVNGVDRSIRTDADRTLLSVLRDELGLTGTKYGCGEGQCGSCSVLVGGSSIRSCQVRVGEVAGREVTTIEGLATEGALNPVQRAFADLGAFQCGFCIPGMIVSATALLRANPCPSEDEIRVALEGNLCRCCGYARILRAVESASQGARLGEDHR
jgi:aerobic-type carbon monoxide dehydrogenase small subunit (CoxS/CutS family)